MAVDGLRQCVSSTSSWVGFYGSGRGRISWIHFLHLDLTIYVVCVAELDCHGHVSWVICGPTMTDNYVKNTCVHGWKPGISCAFCAIGCVKAKLDFWGTRVLITEHCRNGLLLWSGNYHIYREREKKRERESKRENASEKHHFFIGECWAPFHCHCSKVHSGPAW